MTLTTTRYIDLLGEFTPGIVHASAAICIANALGRQLTKQENDEIIADIKERVNNFVASFAKEMEQQGEPLPEHETDKLRQQLQGTLLLAANELLIKATAEMRVFLKDPEPGKYA